MSILIVGGTIIDGIGDRPLKGRAIWVEGRRIKAIAPEYEVGRPEGAQVIDAQGKYIIPGLLNANVHLLGDARLENLLRYSGRYEDLIAEAAQVTLKAGVTTVFDTWGPRAPLRAAQRANRTGEVLGSRFFCSGNIVGLDGPLSLDFLPKTLEVASEALIDRINAMWAENVGPALSWMAAEDVALEVRKYIDRGVDFVKYASSEHRWGDPTTFLLLSPAAQAAIVDEAHKAGLTAQAHASSIESLRAAIEAGCDVIQHCNLTGPYPIPDGTLELLARRKTASVIFPFTERRLAWIRENSEDGGAYFAASDINCRNMLKTRALIVLATDGLLVGQEFVTDARFKKSWIMPGDDNLSSLEDGHFVWLKAMEEKGMNRIEMLKAATRNVAIAYGKDQDLGSLAPGKVADLLILDKDPLEAAENYRSIRAIMKDGGFVDRSSLPTRRLLTGPVDEPTELTMAYRAHRKVGRSGFPTCPMCSLR